MKRDLEALSECEISQAGEELMMLTGEFVALFASGLLALGLVFGTPTFPRSAKDAISAAIAILPALSEFSEVFAGRVIPPPRVAVHACEHSQ